MKVAVLLLGLCACLSACGQKGPLYLPQSEKPTAEKAVQENPAHEKPAQEKQPR